MPQLRGAILDCENIEIREIREKFFFVYNVEEHEFHE